MGQATGKKNASDIRRFNKTVSCMATYHQVGWNPTYTKKHFERVQKTPPKLTFHVLSSLKEQPTFKNAT